MAPASRCALSVDVPGTDDGAGIDSDRQGGNPAVQQFRAKHQTRTSPLVLGQAEVWESGRRIRRRSPDWRVGQGSPGPATPATTRRLSRRRARSHDPGQLRGDDDLSDAGGTRWRSHSGGRSSLADIAPGGHGQMNPAMAVGLGGRRCSAGIKAGPPPSGEALPARRRSSAPGCSRRGCPGGRTGARNAWAIALSAVTQSQPSALPAQLAESRDS